ncbi:hypothetical protein BX616_010260 [Lobosporangium transversale]|uniref:Uncharacterized protein n=1 Tax=Lobosporangium transversale TaxID=64571 RepID=A0A1Y2GQU4_9FUNG|nr:hypothetical protein BCR41DRAFT_404898 [Lobosporangium transversale]KAF9912742.1 hypothetical protein BX616_010260 [Lobosporangium transversale]ORZ19265.1 hypothetical protein BCR41DRAFT_404898 [Lobosporangium transversale]|eukprot:XP_021882433.1 hypothetical protein BCR41DRAFT_404898 [Lobosporangium transversale]
MFVYFNFIINKKNGLKPNKLPRPADIAWHYMSAFAHKELSNKHISEQQLEAIYLALFFIVSPCIALTYANGSYLILPQIENEVKLDRLDSNIINRVLSRLCSRFSKKYLDVEYLLQETLLRDAAIVRHERRNSVKDKNDFQIEKKALEIIRYLMILNKQLTHKLNESTCVSLWNHIWDILFDGTDIYFDTKDLASTSTKAEMLAHEIALGPIPSQVLNNERKTIMLLRGRDGSVSGHAYLREYAFNEHKPFSESQSRPNSIPTQLLSLNRSVCKWALPDRTLIFIDAYGMKATVHGMKIIDGFFGTKPLGDIMLPTTKYELKEFLEGDSLKLLFRYKEHMCSYVENSRLQSLTWYC